GTTGSMRIVCSRKTSSDGPYIRASFGNDASVRHPINTCSWDILPMRFGLSLRTRSVIFNGSTAQEYRILTNGCCHTFFLGKSMLPVDSPSFPYADLRRKSDNISFLITRHLILKKAFIGKCLLPSFNLGSSKIFCA